MQQQKQQSLAPDESISFLLELALQDQKWTPWHWIRHFIARFSYLVLVLAGWWSSISKELMLPYAMDLLAKSLTWAL